MARTLEKKLQLSKHGEGATQQGPPKDAQLAKMWRRRRIIQEIYESERNYVETLKVLKVSAH